MADTLAAVFDATLRALKLKHVTAGSIPEAGDTLQDALDVDRLRVNITGLPGVSPLTWATLALENLWVNFGAPYQDAKYAKSAEGVVYLRGLIKDGTGTAGTRIATLPVGFRPLAKERFAVDANNVEEQLEVGSDGQVIINTALSAPLSLSGISFSVD